MQVSSRCEAGRQRLSLAQSRFGSGAGTSDAAQVWKIPLRYARGKDVATVLFDTPQRSLELGACSDDPVIVNAGGVGFYRVAYEVAALQALTQRFGTLPQADRVALLSDSFALAQAGRLPLQAYVDVLERLPGVTDPSRTMLWSVAGAELGFLDTAMAGRPAQGAVRALGRRLLGPPLEQLGWTPAPQEDGPTAELRGDLIALLARFDHPATIARATQLFDEDDAGTRKLPASLREPVTRVVGMHADRAHFERLLARLKAASGEEERWLLAKALAGGRDAQRAQALLAASRAGVAPANVSASIPGLVARLSPFGDAAYRYTLENWQPLADLAGTWGRQFLLPDAAAGFSTPEQAERLVEDQRRNAGADGNTLAAREAENIRLRAAVRAREAPGLEKAAAD